MKFIGIIPARFESTRFPGKPLAMIQNKPMIQWVVERTSSVLEIVYVATDHEGIAKAVENCGGNYIFTSPDHSSGTDRVAEAALKLSEKIDFDAVINVQGDEPFIRPEQIRELISCFTPDIQIVTLIRQITDVSELENPNKPKVVVTHSGQAIYFSRSIIPYFRGKEKHDWLDQHIYWAHVGMYGYRKDILQQITQLDKGKLEMAESLEQLRWIEYGYRIQTALTHHSNFGIDTPEDLRQALQLF
jgi:3-deoxy-manno-octulosonate cytidylyltransferase (CMP-KDO synthetase)